MITKHPKDLRIEDFQYHLPNEKVAKYPLEKRDEARLLVWHPTTPTISQYKNITPFLPQKSLLVFNQTKVVNARLYFQKATGGKIEIFCLEPSEKYPDVITGMQQTHKVFWRCLVGGASKWKKEETITCITQQNDLRFTATVHQKLTDGYEILFEWNNNQTFADILQVAGEIPIPPYLNRKAEQSDAETYQTIFAKEEGSVAAPTAALHFTSHTLNTLSQKDIDTAQVTLHVGAGTFKPVKSDTMQDHEMHPEFIEVDISFLERLLHQLQQQKTVIAVGTTSVRTLESLYWIGLQLEYKCTVDFQNISVNQWLPYDCTLPPISGQQAINNIIQYLTAREQHKLITRTQIIIAPPYKFQIVDGIVTNFHQPQSTLLLLVSAFIGNNWKQMYEFALANDFRFLSYGDGCLLLKA